MNNSINISQVSISPAEQKYHTVVTVNFTGGGSNILIQEDGQEGLLVPNTGTAQITLENGYANYGVVIRDADEHSNFDICHVDLEDEEHTPDWD